MNGDSCFNLTQVKKEMYFSFTALNSTVSHIFSVAEYQNVQGKHVIPSVKSCDR